MQHRVESILKALFQTRLGISDNYKLFAFRSSLILEKDELTKI